MRAAELLLIGLAGPAAAEVMWDESLPANGDLSGDYLNPTQLAPVAAANCADDPCPLGANQHVAFVVDGPAAAGMDREYFTFTVPAGYQLSKIILDTFTTDPNNQANLGFFGIASGATWPTEPTSTQTSPLLGYKLVGIGDVGTDILSDVGQGAGTQGFTPPLPAGTYSFWAQDNPNIYDVWDLNFVLDATPAVTPVSTPVSTPATPDDGKDSSSESGEPAGNANANVNSNDQTSADDQQAGDEASSDSTGDTSDRR